MVLSNAYFVCDARLRKSDNFTVKDTLQLFRGLSVTLKLKIVTRTKGSGPSFYFFNSGDESGQLPPPYFTGSIHLLAEAAHTPSSDNDRDDTHQV